ncbi:MAG: CCA tRNA nucleotidyltransferase [bacterium]|nr:CCA tRNA nucleotidyltransferase [bacterium]
MKEILKELKPSKKEQQEVKKTFHEIAKSIKIPYTKVILGGSSAKGTWLKDNHDIDIYIQFDKKKYEGMDIAEVLKDNVKNATVLHGSRDYLQLKKGTYTIELIPILKIKKVEQAKNITDVSPFHAKWVNKHKKYKDDIMLAKAFAKANGFYGAESFIKGFSGYSIEVLTIHYKGFKKLLKNVAQWKRSTVIDTEKHHKKKVQLNEAKMLSPLILVDPVQATRNVTAVVSQEKYDLFKKKAKEYLKHPKKEMFVKKEFSLEEIKKKKGEKIILELIPLDGKRDVVGAKLLKCFEYIQEQLKQNDFDIKEANWHWKEGENAIVYFIFKEKKLSNLVRHDGPPLKEKERLKHFQEKWKRYTLKKEKGKVYVLLPRKYKSPEELISNLIESDFIKSKIKSIKSQP